MGKITKEEVESFLHGSDPMERIIKIELDDEYNSNEVTIFYRDENGEKQSIKDDFHPFLWCKANAARRLFNGNRQLIKTKLAEFGIACKKLRTTTDDGFEPERMNNGYKILFYAVKKMSYTQFLKFFEDGDVPVYPKQGHKEQGNNNYICVKPNEQYMISTGKRLFKGFDDYNELVRVQWDLETTGLNGKEETIDQIGIRSNKGFERILTIEGKGAEKMDSQYDAMEEFFRAIEEIDPDVVSGYNSENFDWPFIDDQYEKYGTDMRSESSKYLRKGVYKKKKEAILKLGGEMERYRPTVMYSVNITDGLHAVRRAMALDSNIKSATLKNIAKEFKLNPKNRVYVPGNDISDIWGDLGNNYAFNIIDGDWYRYDPNYVKPKQKITPKYTVKEYDILIEEDKATYARYQTFINKIENSVDETEDCEFVDKETGEIVEYERKYPDGTTGQQLYDEECERLIAESKTFVKGYNGKKFTLYTRNYVADGYELVTGRYIVERYLMDDLRETDAVELQFNQSNFLISKMLPLSFERACTMGTAGIWKYIMLAFSYEQNLAIPESENAVLPIGGLSRLMKTGLCTNVVKIDYNSLYPSIDLTYEYKSEVDIADSMQSMLEFVLSQREYYKELKKKYGKEADQLKEEREMYINTLRIDPRYKHLSDADFLVILEKDEKAVELLNQYNDAKRKSSMYDKMQLPLKILGNSWFGSVSSNVFPWNSGKVGALITSTGRMMFRLLTNHFMKLGYTPIVGDSVTGDTPLFIKYNDTGYIDIVPIEEMVSEKDIERDGFGREYDMSEKPYKVLCRSGWVSPSYIYRHETDKQIYRVAENEMTVDCTEDHSLFDSEQKKIKPSEITENTKLEYYNTPLEHPIYSCNGVDIEKVARLTACKHGETFDRIPIYVLNGDGKAKELFYNVFIAEAVNRNYNMNDYSKTLLAGLRFISKKQVE